MKVWGAAWGVSQGKTDQRGSASVELAVLAVPCVMMLAVMATGFRVADAQHRMAGVASSAAREASLGRDAANASTLAENKARQELGVKALQCTPAAQVQASYDPGSEGSGQPGFVTVTVRCAVPFSDLGFPLLRGSRTLTDVAVSPIDLFRADSQRETTPSLGGR